MFQFDDKQIPLFWCHLSTKKNNLRDKDITNILSIRNYRIQEKKNPTMFHGHLLHHNTMTCILKLQWFCHVIGSVQFSWVAQSCPTLCDPMDHSTPGLPVHHELPEFTQTHVHWIGDAIQPSHPLSSPSPPALNLSQHQSLFNYMISYKCIFLHMCLNWLGVN